MLQQCIAIEEILNWQFLNCGPSIWEYLYWILSVKISSTDAICFIEVVLNNAYVFWRVFMGHPQKVKVSEMGNSERKH